MPLNWGIAFYERKQMDKAEYIEKTINTAKEILEEKVIQSNDKYVDTLKEIIRFLDNEKDYYRKVDMLTNYKKKI